MPQTWMEWLVSAVFLGLSTAAAAQPVPVNRTPDATLHSTPETVVWGYFAADIPPVATNRCPCGAKRHPPVELRRAKCAHQATLRTAGAIARPDKFFSLPPAK